MRASSRGEAFRETETQDMKHHIRTVAPLAVIAAIALVACGGRGTTASKSAAAYDDAKHKGLAVEAGEHGVHSAEGAAPQPTTPTADAGQGETPGADHGSMPGMHHSQTTAAGHAAMAGMAHTQMAGMDHSKMPGMPHGAAAGHAAMAGMAHTPIAGRDHSTL